MRELTLAEAAAGPGGEVVRGSLTLDDENRLIFWLKARQQLERKRYECIRVDGGMLCEWCKRPYRKHPQPEPELCPTLVTDCEGRRLKL
jgi:hypothetical protein